MALYDVAGQPYDDATQSYDGGTIAPTPDPLPHVRVLWRPEQFSRVSNPSFILNATGWSVAAGLNQPGTSITRIITDGHLSATCGELVCPAATSDAGVNFDLAPDTYYPEYIYGTVYAAIVWLKRVSGGRRAKIVLGSLGTATDRASVTVDLVDGWRAYRVVWRPQIAYTDVQFAVTNGQADALTVRIDDLTVYQLDAFSQVENSNFTWDTTGYSIAGGISGVATSLTRVGDGMDPKQQTCAELVTTAIAGSGTDYDLGNRGFYGSDGLAGSTGQRAFRARVAMKSISGTTSARLRLGSLAATTDRGDKIVTLTTDWAFYEVDWTPFGLVGAYYRDVKLAISNGAAAAMTARVGLIEVFEAADDISAPYLAGANIKRGEAFDGTTSPGTMALTLNDTLRVFDPMNGSTVTGSILWGSVVAGRRIWARCTYANKIYPLFFGTIRSIEPRVWDKQVDLLAEDPFYDFGLTPILDPSFAQDGSYTGQRWSQLPGEQHFNLAQDSTEAGRFFSQADTSTDVLGYLSMLNEATGTAHYIHPRATAEHLWEYRTVTRATLTDASVSAETVDDDFNDLTGYRFTDEALENHQFVPWQSYEQLAEFGTVAQAANLAVYSGWDIDLDDPYLHYVDERYGSNSGVPAPMFETHKIWRQGHRERAREQNHGFRHKPPVRHLRTLTQRIYPDAFVPFTIPAASSRQTIVDFDIPMSGMYACIDVADNADATNDGDFTVYSATATPRQIVVTLSSDASDRKVDRFRVFGTPWEPFDVLLEECALWDSIVDKGDHAGPSISTPYIPSKAAARGLGDYRNWRYGTARLRLRLKVQHRFPSVCLREITDHLTLNAARWNIAGAVFGIRALEIQLGTHGDERLWSTYYDIEAIPSGGPWVTIGGATETGIGSAAVLAH